VNKRKKKILTIQILMFFLGISIIYFTYYYKELPNQNIESQLLEDKNKIQIDAKQEQISNTFENIEYNGIDLNGNRYNIKSKTADFEFENPELINMKVMFATFYFKDGTILKVEGDYGTYNNKNNNMEFRENIVAEYENNYLYADNLDYFNTLSMLTIYGNVRSESIQGNIMADKLKFDVSLKTLDISMFTDRQVNVKIKN